MQHEVSLVFEGGVVKTCKASGDQTILDAALEDGLPLAYQCRSGSCGTCIGRVITGSVEHVAGGATALTAREREAGMALMCSATAASEVEVELAYPEDWAAGTEAPRGHQAHVEAVEHLCESVYRLDLIVDDHDEPFLFRPGQYVQVIVPGSGGVDRSFSMVTSPDDLPRLSLLVRYLPGGVMSEYLRTACQPGDAIQFEGPFGTFVGRPHQAERHVMVAGGTGVAPLLSILDGLRTGPQGLPSTEFVFGVVDAEEFFALDELEIRQFWSKNLSLTLCAEKAPDDFDQVRGTPIDGLRSIDPRPEDRFYVSGPPGMVTAATAFLSEIGVESTRVHVEQFTISEGQTA